MSISYNVANPFITYISFITGTGFIKCISIIFCGLFVCDANLLIDIDDVLDARITFGCFANLLSLFIIYAFKTKFSIEASITRSQSCNSSNYLKYENLSSTLNLSSEVDFFAIYLWTDFL